MKKKKINPEDLKVAYSNITGNSHDVKGDKNYNPNDPKSILSTNVCHTIDCETLLDECWPTWNCETKDCHTNDGCIQTESGHMECCPITEEGPCPNTTDCVSVAQLCPSVDVCFETEKFCDQTEDCIAVSRYCEVATDDGGGCLETVDNGCEIATYADGSCGIPIQTVDDDCVEETRICGE